MGTVLHLDTAQKPRKPRRKPAVGEPQVVLFTGVRYDRDAAGKGGRDPTGAQPGRKQV